MAQTDSIKLKITNIGRNYFVIDQINNNSLAISSLMQTDNSTTRNQLQITTNQRKICPPIHLLTNDLDEYHGKWLTDMPNENFFSALPEVTDGTTENAETETVKSVPRPPRTPRFMLSSL